MLLLDVQADDFVVAQRVRLISLLWKSMFEAFHSTVLNFLHVVTHGKCPARISSDLLMLI